MTRINVVGVTRIFGTDERMVAALEWERQNHSAQHD
jgi:hypothetical protein